VKHSKRGSDAGFVLVLSELEGLRVEMEKGEKRE
jgi:hypothetical protein